MFVIGDTPHDIDCANAIGARTIAVGTGGYTVDELREHRPWRVFDELPPPDEFVRLIERRSPAVGHDPERRGMKRGIRRFPRAVAGDAAGAALVSRARRRVSRLARDPRRRTASCGTARATPHGRPARADGDGDRLLCPRGHARKRAAAALTFRGAEVHALLCDGAMTACAECEASLYPNLARFVAHGPSRDLCRDCLWPAERVYRSSGSRSTATATG